MFEVDATGGWDETWCLVSPEDAIRERLRSRGLDDAGIEARLAAQWPVERKAAAADRVIRNDAGLDDFHQRLDEAFRETFMTKENPNE